MVWWWFPENENKSNLGGVKNCPINSKGTHIILYGQGVLRNAEISPDIIKKLYFYFSATWQARQLFFFIVSACHVGEKNAMSDDSLTIEYNVCALPFQKVCDVAVVLLL